ncbi:MAG: YceI family protein [Rhodococcus sp. (in: high G+C Gram-positive bacteria)]|uniref:YceI family protein n=1 Tax=Rhodococcus sp. TaxID=1831 RepID=UPI003BB02D7A
MSSAQSAPSNIPGYVPGTWRIDPDKSELKFSVKHLNLHTVHGSISGLGGHIAVGQDPLESEVNATLDLTTVDTESKGRDKAILSKSLLDVQTHPTATYRSTGLRVDPAAAAAAVFVLEGELTLLGVTNPVPLRMRFERFVTDPDGRTRPIFTARGEFVRRDFGFVYHVKPQFLDKAIGATVSVDIRIEGAQA